MHRLTLFLAIICILSIPSLAQDSTDCIAHTEDATLELFDEWFLWENWYEFLNEGVLAYLNTAGNTNNLVASIESEDTELITAQTFSADVDNNSINDFLLMTLLNFGGGYTYQIAVYTCDEGTYRLLDDFVFGEMGMGATLELIADTNRNNIPEIIMRPTYTPRKYYESLHFYEWNGSEFVLIFQTAWEYGGYGDVYLTNFDDDPTNIEILVERLYSYGEATAEAYIELWLRRPVNIVFTWTGETYEQFCEYFTDTPTVLYLALHSAEAHRQCGQYDDALVAYHAIIDDYYRGDYEDYALEGTNGGFALTPEANETVDSVQFERDYLTAFALYRVIQLTLYLNEYNAADNALSSLERMHMEFPTGERGYRYTAMADALYTEYIESGNMNAACAAAETAFNTVRDTDADPAIPYFINDDGEGGTWKFPFYWNSGKAYSADPDNLFAVPADIGNIVFIPVCVQ